MRPQDSSSNTNTNRRTNSSKYGVIQRISVYITRSFPLRVALLSVSLVFVLHFPDLPAMSLFPPRLSSIFPQGVCFQAAAGCVCVYVCVQATWSQTPLEMRSSNPKLLREIFFEFAPVSGGIEMFCPLKKKPRQANSHICIYLECIYPSIYIRVCVCVCVDTYVSNLNWANHLMQLNPSGCCAKDSVAGGEDFNAI